MRAETTARPVVLRDFLVSYLPFLSQSGAVQGVHAVIQEVTELKQAAHEIQRRKERLVLALEIARISSWDWDFETDQLRPASADVSRHAMKPAPSAATMAEFLSTVRPDDRARVERAVKATIERDAP